MISRNSPRNHNSFFLLLSLEGHKHGPNSRKTVKAVREVDNILVELMEEIEEQGLSEKVNVVIISDHGMTTSTKTINLEKYVDFNDIDKVVGDGAFAMIAPEKRKVDSVSLFRASSLMNDEERLELIAI